MRTSVILIKQLLTVLLVITVLACSKEEERYVEPDAVDICNENPCDNPAQCPDACNADNTGNTGNTDSHISKEDFNPEGKVTETDDGYIVEGKLTMETTSDETVVFTEAALDMRFNEDGTLRSVSGSVEIPSPSNYFEFADPIRADIGYFSGKFLNDNRDFEIILKEDRSYWVFAIAASFELSLGANDDEDATKPLSISPPVGGHITYIADYSDPMFFFSQGKDSGLGGDSGNDGNGSTGSDGGDGSSLMSASFGLSKNANLLYEPTMPVENLVSFDAKRVRGGTFSFWGVFEASGLLYEYKEFGGDLFLSDPLESEISYDYRSGINGTIDFSLDITSFISFGFPIGAGSTAVVAEAVTDGTILAKAFVNGLVDPDLSWWPDFIPVKPNGHLHTYGYADQTGIFDIGLSGRYEIEMPSGTQALEGSMTATNDSLNLNGAVTIEDEIWGASMVFTKEETSCIASQPTNFADGISETVTGQIDMAIETTEKALEDVKKANETYEFELSLRGLRAALPTIIDDAKEAIDDAVAAGIKSGREQADKILDENNRALCSDNISSKVNGLVKPYQDALDRLKDAVDESNDTAQTRTELEAALRNLAGLNKIDKSTTVTITHGNKKILGVPKCTQTSDAKRTVNINATILSSTQVSQLNEAAENVQYIAEADGIRFDAQQLLDKLPSMDELERLKDNIEACVAELTDKIGDVGFVFNHDTKEFRHFMVINGEEKEVAAFNIFNGDELISNARLELNMCNTSDELFKLKEAAKLR
ncbi:hypothetical protein EHW67_02670 [Arenibacter aquaticus]|uniref:Uncharacterized protein n=1 Tax=Arenibacter aquaticus TaxID=2489054 RepID=A0A3S0B1E7_9FLAO|nr:hypothetical protein [Arenibacter aquaticus]RTE55486.1 hypothetical protein EHW67_02670 [Arenibacter aquaticus]